MIYIPEHYYKRKSNRYGKNVIVFKLIQIQHGYLYIRILFNKNNQANCDYMGCKHHILKSLKNQYKKKIWNMMKHKPSYSYCTLSNCVCYAKYDSEHRIFGCDNYE